MRVGRRAAVWVLGAVVACGAMWAQGPFAGLNEGQRAMYGLEFARARAWFEERIRVEPAAAENYNYLANAILAEWLHESGGMAKELMGGGGKDSKAQTMESGGEKRMLWALERAVELSEARIQKKPEEAAGRYDLGVAHGLKSKYEYLVKRSWTSALGEAKRSQAAHREVLEKEPGNQDARMVPAMASYVAGSLPFWAKPFAALLGVRGDRKKGLEELEQSAKGAKRAAVEARQLLAVAYRREKRYLDAAEVLGQLRGAFPANYWYGAGRVLMLAEGGRMREARAELKELEGQGTGGRKMPEEMLNELRRRIDEKGGRAN